jgi:hypothetical protein
MSVGYEIAIDGQVYICADFGFIKKENAEIKEIRGSIYSVQEKEKV